MDKPLPENEPESREPAEDAYEDAPECNCGANHAGDGCTGPRYGLYDPDDSFF